MSATATLKPGDPPPFWEGLWHPEGKTEGAVMVKPLMAGEARQSAPMAMPAAAPIAMPAAEAPIAMPAAPAIAMPAAPPPPPAIAMPAAPPPAEAPARSFVLTLVAQGPLSTAPGLPQQADPAGSEALRAKARELAAANQLGPALQALSQALARSPGEAATYAQMGQTLLAGRAWEDAAHHCLIAYMLAPREVAYGRMTLNAAFVLGYVGWTFQLAQGLYKLQPAPDLAELGRQAHGWLQSRVGAMTALCTACRATSILTAPGPCPKCGAASPLGAPAHATGFAGLKLLQQNAPQGRLFAGASCVTCKSDTVLVLSKGGPRCQTCQGPALAPV